MPLTQHQQMMMKISDVGSMGNRKNVQWGHSALGKKCHG